MKLNMPLLAVAVLALGLAVGARAGEPPKVVSKTKSDAKTKADAKTAAKEPTKTVTVNDETFIIPAEAEQGNANELLLKKFDLNRDGKIDEAEIAAVQARTAPTREPNLAKTEEGRKVTLKDLYEGGNPAKRKAPTKVTSDDFLRQYDVNHDGKIDANELEALKRDLEKNATQRAPELRTAPEKPLPPLPSKPQPVVRQPIR